MPGMPWVYPSKLSSESAQTRRGITHPALTFILAGPETSATRKKAGFSRYVTHSITGQLERDAEHRDLALESGDDAMMPFRGVAT